MATGPKGDKQQAWQNESIKLAELHNKRRPISEEVFKENTKALDQLTEDRIAPVLENWEEMRKKGEFEGVSVYAPEGKILPSMIVPL